MKVVNILGSPRKKGTSARIAKSFTDEAEQLGIKVEHFYLNGMEYRGCQGCEQCHTKLDKCVLEDDLSDVFDAMYTADVTVFSSPVYYGDVSGQFKMFFDRTWSLLSLNGTAGMPYTSRLPKGKTAILILCQGDIEEVHVDIVERYKSFLDLYGYDLKVIRATGLDSSPAADVSIPQARIISLARLLFNVNE